MEKLTVACWYWRDNQDRCERAYVYGPEDVSLLRNQVARNLSLPHEFVCVTDRTQEIERGIRTIAIDRRLHIPGGRYAKMAVFAPDAEKVFGGRILTLDLDTVVVGALDPLVNRPEDLVMWRNPNFGLKRRAFYNTSMMLIRAGVRPQLYESFSQKMIDEAHGKTGWGGTDQRLVSYMLARGNPHDPRSYKDAHWTAEDGIYGAGRLGDYHPELAHTVLPKNARIVFFPGRRHPKQEKVREKHPWIPEHRW